MYHVQSPSTPQSFRPQYLTAPTPSSGPRVSSPMSSPRIVMDASSYSHLPASPTGSISPNTPHFTPGTSFSPTAGSGHSARPYVQSSLSTAYDLAPASSLVQPNYQVTVWEHSQLEGVAGSIFKIKCEVNFPASPSSSTGSSPESDAGMTRGRALRVVFGQHPLPTSVTLLPDRRAASGQLCELTVTVPSWNVVGGMPNKPARPMVYVQVLSDGHALLSSTAIGEFSYLDAAPRGTSIMAMELIPAPIPTYASFVPSAANPLKRAGEALDSHRPSPAHMTHRRVLSNGAMRYDSPELQQQVIQSYQNTPVVQSDGFSNYGSPYLGVATLGGGQPSYGVAPQPNLQRASQIPSVPPVVASYPSSSSGKATLELQGDLSNMAKGWTTDEWSNRRRLVQFWRKQDGTNIVAAHSPIAQQDYSGHQQSIIVSCIFREDDNQCYITSVDTIYLLEALVGNRFTVEEKNRIRRNLEGFRPITVSKTKPNSEDFFKLIMSFPNPKPRNIEKDVKVFGWDILGQALKKIIGKYSASYAGSVTPQPAPPPPLPTYPSAYQSMGEIIPPPLQSASNSYDGSTDSVPTLVSHHSSDSTHYAQSSSTVYGGHPETPQLTHTNSNGSVHSPIQHGHFRGVSVPQVEKQAQESYLNISPPNAGAYAPPPGAGFWASGEDVMASPGSSGTYGTMQPGMGYEANHYSEQPHHLPHVHQSVSRNPSSNDLRIVYSGMSQ